ncbi:MAG: sodium:proton antiporter [Desulfurococcaceae archaeon]
MDTSLINTYLLSTTLSALLINTVISLYGIFFKPHYTKKVIALTILSDSVNTFAIYLGYRRWTSETSPRPPVLTSEPTPWAVFNFVRQAVDPLPQALVLTAIVIGLAVTLFLIFLGYIMYTHYKTLDMRDIRRLKG